MYATRHMRILLRLNAPFFISWGMEMLIGQLYDLSPGIADEAIDILDEACEEEVNDENIIMYIIILIMLILYMVHNQ